VSGPGTARAFADWLALREPADAAARAPELADRACELLAGRPRTVVHDLGSGTGSMGRWLAPRLLGRQHWVLYDRDADLLGRAARGLAGLAAADGAPVTVETRCADITRLTAADLDGGSLVTASALLDMLTGAEVDRVVAACAGAGCAVLATISVVGRVELAPADPLDGVVAAAFNAHQRRTVGARTLLGPDAPGAAVAAFARHGLTAVVRPSPWRLGPDRAALTAEWLAGWVGAAGEQRPELGDRLAEYADRRLAQAADGRLGALVDHQDIFVAPK
jgi:hypothetical protein